jgi:hypothetical protein
MVFKENAKKLRNAHLVFLFAAASNNTAYSTTWARKKSEDSSTKSLRGQILHANDLKSVGVSVFLIWKGYHEGKLIMVIRGMDNFSNMLMHFNLAFATSMAKKALKEIKSEIGKVKVKTKPMDCWRGRSSSSSDEKIIWICGHSLGGLLAEIPCSN